MQDRKGHQTKICLRLATTRGKPEQIGDVAVFMIYLCQAREFNRMYAI